MDPTIERLGHRLLQLGLVLFLIGLLTGFAVPALRNPRMGLASHLEGIMNGMLLVILGLLWPRLRLARRWFHAAFWLAIYGTFANWTATLLAALWGAGSAMPIAGGGREGAPIQEAAITALLVTLSLAMIALILILLAGLRLRAPDGGTRA